MNFDAHIQKALDCKSLPSARDWFHQAIANAIQILNGKSDEELLQPLPEATIMGGAPRQSVIGALSEHTAHHRGALSVYSRLLNKLPPMPYGEF